MIDFHCHIDLYPDPRGEIDAVARQGSYVLAVTTTPKSVDVLRRMVDEASATRIRVAIGLHPELIRERFREVDEVVRRLAEFRYVGEIGLDGSPSLRPSFALQESALRTILEKCSSAGGRVLSIHSRHAAAGVLDLLAEFPRAGVAVLHWFSGSAKELERAVQLGCWFSVGPAMLRGQKGRLLAEAIPLDRVVTETDGPFVRRGPEPLRPAEVGEAESALAAIKGVSVEEIQRMLLLNLKQLLSSPSVPAVSSSPGGATSRLPRG